MLFHLVMLLLKNDRKRVQREQHRGLKLINAIRSSTADDPDDTTFAAVAMECEAWVRENGVASPESARFSDVVARWIGDSFGVFGAVDVNNDRGETIRHWYVAEVDSKFRVLFADMLSFDPFAVDVAALEKALYPE